jgi:hypothetical protein
MAVLPILLGAAALAYVGKRVFFPSDEGPEVADVEHDITTIQKTIVRGLSDTARDIGNVKPPKRFAASGPPPLVPSPQSPGHLVNAVAQNPYAKTAADALYHYLKLSGADGSQDFQGLVHSFQTAAASDPKLKAIVGMLPLSGIYDQKTSAALTVYTRDPVPAQPGAPKPIHPSDPATIHDASIPSHASLAGFNLYSYLLAHGDDGSEPESKLVSAFQEMVNTDPKFGGPANKTVGHTFIGKKQKVSGIYDNATADALQVAVGVRVPPGAGAGIARKIQQARTLGRSVVNSVQRDAARAVSDNKAVGVSDDGALVNTSDKNS